MCNYRVIAYETPVFNELKHGKKIHTPRFHTNVISIKMV